MKVLVDTSIWSLALRRNPTNLTAEQNLFKEELAELIQEGRAEIMGPVRQELLSGFREEVQFQRLREHLRLFDDVFLTREDYEEGARIHNKCRAAGIAGSAIDFLICAVALRRKWQIFTRDQDFHRYAGQAAIGLYKPRIWKA